PGGEASCRHARLSGRASVNGLAIRVERRHGNAGCITVALPVCRRSDLCITKVSRGTCVKVTEHNGQFEGLGGIDRRNGAHVPLLLLAGSGATIAVLSVAVVA